MKMSRLLILIFCSLFFFTAKGSEKSELEKIDSQINKLNCTSVTNFKVVSKREDNVYEINYISGSVPITGPMSSHGNVYGFSNQYSLGLLKAHSFQYKSAGAAYETVYVKLLSKKKVKLENGFEKEVPFWEEDEECKKLSRKYIDLATQIGNEERRKENEKWERERAEEEALRKKEEQEKKEKEKKYLDELNKKQQKVKALYE